MANLESGNKISDELARESLIAISYSLPDKDPPLGSFPTKHSSDNFVEANNCDKAENIRSELISISYTESPDSQPQPHSPGENKA